MNYSTTALLVSLLVIATYLTIRLYIGIRRLQTRYAPIIDVDSEVARVKETLVNENRQLQEFLSDNERQRGQLDQEYREAKSTYEGLRRQISLLEENLEDISFGLYTPHFNFQTSEEYKVRLDTLRAQEKQLIHDGKAASCPTQWTVGGSASEGARMVKLNEKLVLRAFNGECDAALANVSWNNVTRMEERIRNSFETINRLVTVLNVSITEEFFSLKLDELRLAHEYQEKQNEEREQQRRIREQIREEEKVQHEIEKAREEAEREAKRSQEALEKARAEAALASGEQLQKLNEHIKSLEADLEEARLKRESGVTPRILDTEGAYLGLVLRAPRCRREVAQA
jgi:chromosome segregation ATPase